MDPNLLVAVVTSLSTAASTAGVAITAIIVNNKRFDTLEKRIDGIDKRLDYFDQSVNRRFDRIEQDLKQFYSLLSEHSTDIARLKDKADLK